MDRSDKVAIGCIVLSLVVALGATGWNFLHTKEYTYVIETECDPATEVCFERDCSIEDECPPNGLGVYKVYRLSAKDFESCSDDSCHTQCIQGSVTCEEQVCGESEDDTCYEPAELPLEEESGTTTEPVEEPSSL